MLGLKRFRCTSITIAGIELMHRIRKGQLKLASFASRAELRPKSGMQFSLHEPIHALEHLAALIPKICSATKRRI